MAWKKAGGRRREGNTHKKNDDGDDDDDNDHGDDDDKDEWRWRWWWMIADASQMSYIHDFMPCLSPQRVCSRAGTWATVRIKRHVVFTQRKKYTENILQTETFTQRGIYTEQLLHRQTLLHTDAFTYRSFYTEKPFLKKPCHMSLYTEKLYTQTLFHKEVFTHRNFNAQMPKLLHTGAFAHTRLTKRSF